ncbi:carbohydrate ABC transporter permease [Quadrisphaera setariae]|uniref:carbohydrate ABC transporter permease n=1 Tax=Quadrisphaera setariae TaxID=2593304 RepID=UPI001C9D190B|nr:sugar ABC transporter permease [Quadrisphaera setariae]
MTTSATTVPSSAHRAGAPGGGAQAAGRQERRVGTGARRRWAMWWFVLPAALYVLAFFAVPVVNNITTSFREYTTATFYTGEAPFVGLANYVDVISSRTFGRTTLNTAVFTVVSLAATFVIGLALAVFFNAHFRLNSVLRSLVLLPWLLPLIISSAVWRRMMEGTSGVLNELLGLVGLGAVPWLTDPAVALYSVIIVNVWVGIPFVMVILYGGLQEIPRDLYEAASLDGATGLRAFRSITWPLLRPVVVIVLMLGFIYTVRVLDIVLALTGGGPAGASDTYATQAYQLSFRDFQFGTGAALSNILIVVTLLVAALQLRANRRANDLAG